LDLALESREFLVQLRLQGYISQSVLGSTADLNAAGADGRPGRTDLSFLLTATAGSLGRADLALKLGALALPAGLDPGQLCIGFGTLSPRLGSTELPGSRDCRSYSGERDAYSGAHALLLDHREDIARSAIWSKGPELPFQRHPEDFPAPPDLVLSSLQHVGFAPAELAPFVKEAQGLTRRELQTLRGQIPAEDRERGNPARGDLREQEYRMDAEIFVHDFPSR
jgi:hypothetical protein